MIIVAVFPLVKLPLMLTYCINLLILIFSSVYFSIFLLVYTFVGFYQHLPQLSVICPGVGGGL